MPVPLQQAAEQMLSPTRKLGGSYEEIILSSPKMSKPTNSCTGIVRTQAGVFATLYPHKKTGYKEPNSESNVKPTGHFTTYKHSYEITAQLPSQTQTSPQQKFRPKLLPYSPTAICNRLPVVFANEAIPGARFCAPRNIHQFDLGAKPYPKRFVSSHKTMYPKWEGLPLGFENNGIMSDFARKIHDQQRR